MEVMIVTLVASATVTLSVPSVVVPSAITFVWELNFIWLSLRVPATVISLPFTFVFQSL